MWGKKKEAEAFDASATRVVTQMIEGIAKSGVGAEHLLATDGALHSYFGQRIKWELVFVAAAAQSQSTPFDYPAEAYAYANGAFRVLQMRSKPYWVSEPGELTGVAPISVLAFLGSSHRMKIAKSVKADPNTLDLMAGDGAAPGDGDDYVRSAALMNLVSRGLRTLNTGY
jgi:hypothetical protein